jgi:nucleotide-binding universal stress UspA family protein
MGTGNSGWLGRFVLGGVSTFVLHRSTEPTLVAHRPPSDGRESVRVVVGTDGSPAARRAIDALIGLARPDRCDIFVRSVVELELTPPTGPEMSIEPAAALGRTLGDAAEDADRFMREALGRVSDAGFECDGDVVRGSTEVALLDAVQDRDADLVVVGTRGRGRFAAIALGSVSAHLVRAAPATLVAPAPGTDTGGDGTG